MLEQFHRFAVYFAPTGDLARAGAAWLGWDPVQGEHASRPGAGSGRAYAETQEYGLHGTLAPPCAWPAPRGWGHPRLLGHPFYCAPRPDRSAPLHFPVDEIHCGTLHHLVDRRFRDTTDDPVRIRQPADIRGRTACASARPIPCPTPVVRICTLPRVSCTAICNATVRVDEFLATDRRSGCHWFIVHMVPFSACRCSHESFICSGL